MKTTIDIDEKLLTSVMTLTGVKTRRGAVNYALLEAEKSAKVERLVRESPPDDTFKAAVAEGYDIAALREQEIPER